MFLAALVAQAVFVGGCVSVVNDRGLTPPTALCSHFRATVGVPRGPVPVGTAKSVRTDCSVHVKEWFFSGASAGLTDMAIASAAEQGGLKKVYYADYEQTSYLGFVTVFHLTVYGE